MKTINLTQGQVALVDDWHYEELNQHKWQAKWSKNTQSFYAMHNEGWPFQQTILMHRVVANTPKGLQCDHQNHNTLDNQEHNLRNVTHSQNQMNSRVQSNNTLGERCICPHQNGYRVQVRKGGEIVFRKNFPTLDEAIIARDEALKKYHGDFAYSPK